MSAGTAPVPVQTRPCFVSGISSSTGGPGVKVNVAVARVTLADAVTAIEKDRPMTSGSGATSID